MKKKKLTTRIVLDLADDEFLELGALGYSVDTWKPEVVQANAFGRMLIKLKAEIEKKATTGQRDHLEKIVFAIQEAARVNPEAVEGFRNEFSDFIGSAEEVMEDLNR